MTEISKATQSVVSLKYIIIMNFKILLAYLRHEIQQLSDK